MFLRLRLMLRMRVHGIVFVMVSRWIHIRRRATRADTLRAQRTDRVEARLVRARNERSEGHPQSAAI